MFDILILLFDAAEHVGVRVLARVVQLFIELSIQLVHVFLGFAFVHLQLASLQGQLFL